MISGGGLMFVAIPIAAFVRRANRESGMHDCPAALREVREMLLVKSKKSMVYTMTKCGARNRGYAIKRCFERAIAQ